MENKKMQGMLPALSVLALVILIPALGPRAQEVQVEIAQPTLHFLTADTGQENRGIEPSGVAPIGDGSLLLVACDKNESLMVVEAATGRVKQSLKLGTFGNRPSGRTWHRTMSGPITSLAHVLLKCRLKRGQKRNSWTFRVCCVSACEAMELAERHSSLTQNRSWNGI
jgi:hypothetical protein